MSGSPLSQHSLALQQHPIAHHVQSVYKHQCSCQLSAAVGQQRSQHTVYIFQDCCDWYPDLQLAFQLHWVEWIEQQHMARSALACIVGLHNLVQSLLHIPLLTHLQERGLTERKYGGDVALHGAVNQAEEAWVKSSSLATATAFTVVDVMRVLLLGICTR